MSRKSRRKNRQQQQATPPAVTPPTSPDPPKPTIGRRGHFCPETCAAIVKAVREGFAYKHAAEKAGVSERTLYDWLAKGREEPDTPHAQFSQDIKNAAAEFAGECVANIKAASLDEWQAAAWLLERKHPDQFAAERVRLKALETQVADLLTRLAAAEAARGIVGTGSGDGTGGGAADAGGGGPAPAA